MKRRDALKAIAGATAGLVSGSISRSSNAQTQFLDLPEPMTMPVIYVAHGSPLLLTDPVRGIELERWGASLPKPKGIVVMTPHYRAQEIELGHVGEGFAMYNLPAWIAARTPKVSYKTPSNAALASRVRDLLAPRGPVKLAADRPGFDHTTWIPLFHMFPKADVPVVEVALPFAPGDAVPLVIGSSLAPLRHEGVLIMASGTVTHNLAATDMTGNTPVPAWSRDFDTWVKKSLASKEVGPLLAWRQLAPRADVAHPDDGGHFRVLHFAFGAAMNDGHVDSVQFPIEGFELGNLSKRCVEIA